MSDDEQKQEELEAQVDELLAGIKARSQKFAEAKQDLEADLKGQLAGLDQDFALMSKEVAKAEAAAESKMSLATKTFLAE